MSTKVRFPWQKLRWLFYDCEIMSCIPQPGEEIKDHAYKYCAGWHDHANMGIACICTYTSWDNSYRVFDDDNLDGFKKLIAKTDRIVGFNSKSFDDKLCAANNIKISTDYDLLGEVRLAAGMPENYVKGVTRSGYDLNSLGQASLSMTKSGSGEFAPVLFQDGKQQAVQAYCLNDVFMSVQLLRLGWEGRIIDPTSGDDLQLRPLR